PISITAANKKIVRDCAAVINVGEGPMKDRGDLAALYIYTNDTAKAESIIDAMLKTRGSEAERGEALVAGIRLAIAKWDPFAGANPQGEKLARELDALSDSAIAQKIDGHYALLGRYDYADLDDPIRDQ